jgi:hypothetical protein
LETLWMYYIGRSLFKTQTRFELVMENQKWDAFAATVHTDRYGTKNVTMLGNSICGELLSGRMRVRLACWNGPKWEGEGRSGWSSDVRNCVKLGKGADLKDRLQFPISAAALV